MKIERAVPVRSPEYVRASRYAAVAKSRRELEEAVERLLTKLIAKRKAVEEAKLHEAEALKALTVGGS